MSAATAILRAAVIPALLAAWGPVAAQSTNAQPDLTKTDARLDPTKFTGLPEPAKKALAQAQGAMKAGEIAGFVFAASPGMNVWALNAAPKGTAAPSAADLARTTLETCEFSLGAPCAILSIDGYDTTLKTGGWAKQPAMLLRRPGDFDAAVVPFVPAGVRTQTAPYGKATGPRAFAVTAAGGWIWRSGPTIAEAVSRTMTDCAAQFRNSPCILYAVNDRVVFGSR